MRQGKTTMHFGYTIIYVPFEINNRVKKYEKI